MGHDVYSFDRSDVFRHDSLDVGYSRKQFQYLYGQCISIKEVGRIITKGATNDSDANRSTCHHIARTAMAARYIRHTHKLDNSDSGIPESISRACASTPI